MQEYFLKDNGLENIQISTRIENQIMRGNYIGSLIEKSFMNRNQIANIAGLSNSYVKGLEDGVIVNPKKPNLVFLGIALNLDLQEIDNLLEFFNQPKLVREDAYLFHEVARRRELTKTLQPLYGNISLDLLLLSMERIKGKLILFNDKLPLASNPRGYMSSLYGLTHNLIYSYIAEYIHDIRRNLMIENMEENEFHFFTTEALLKKYMRNNASGKLREYLLDSTINIINLLGHHNFKFNIIKKAPLFRFGLKHPAPSEQTSSKLFFVSHTPYGDDGTSEYREPWLRGYATDDDVIVKQFNQEYEKFEIDVVMSKEEKLKEFMIELLYKEGKFSRMEINEKLK